MGMARAFGQSGRMGAGESGLNSASSAREAPLAPDRCTLAASDLEALADGRHGNPFAVLGPHALPDARRVVRAYLPGATSVEIAGAGAVSPMAETAPGLFEGYAQDDVRYRLGIRWGETYVEIADPYAFPLLLSAYDLHLITQGRHFNLPRVLGANPVTIDGVDGVLFAVWAPNASSAAVVGNFNSWDPRRHPMRKRIEAGVFELFVPGIGAGEIYKFALRDQNGAPLPWKADPLAKMAELPPRTGSVVATPDAFAWGDEDWMARRATLHGRNAPISIYEVHVESWLRTPDGQPTTWDAAADRLLPYVADLGFTHVELMPIAEYPFGGSWGYQPLGMFAPTARLGDPAAFARFVDRAHAMGLGVILDWVPAHFPADAHGLARFDGTALYEHLDPREGYHPDWNTMIYNLGRSEVRGFLVASAVWWLERFHLDGLRVDAVASMLYRDYSRKSGEWIPNQHGGRENLEAIAFLQSLNATVSERCPGALVIAEESTAWPGVTAKDWHSKEALGFDYKWNMGWMHDTLRFLARDPVHRGWHLDDITFGLEYGFSEAYVLPLSHDEVVHGKGSLISRMPGDDWQRFANLRLLFALMWTHPGKKLLFMGGEFGCEGEWKVDDPFPWPHPYDEKRSGVRRMIGDLNRLYRSRPELHALDREPAGFSWIIQDNAADCVLAFRRTDGAAGRALLVVLNATPVPRFDFRVGVPIPGVWHEVFNSDAGHYGGSNLGNGGRAYAEAQPWHGQAASLSLILPPLGLLVLAPATG
jgi:1,4-alpha-glucan branching enzyme